MTTVVKTEMTGNISSLPVPASATNSHDEGDEPSDMDSNMCQPCLTKRQLKKLKKQEKWLKIKPDKRAKDRKRKKQYRKQAREQNIYLGPSRKSLKRNTMEHSACRIKVAVDCSFDNLMTERSVSQLIQQLQHCYSANRRAVNPLQFYVTGIDGKTEQRINELGDYKGWDVHFKTPDYLDVFNKEDVIYLTSESPNVLSTLEESKVYIIGGIVDHNHQKGLCHKLACENNISHAQLPISKYLELKTRKVLTINHVFEILLRFTESSSWEQAFDAVIPKRKGVFLKSDIGTVNDTNTTAVDDRTLLESAGQQKDCCGTISDVVTGGENVPHQLNTNHPTDLDED